MFRIAGHRGRCRSVPRAFAENGPQQDRDIEQNRAERGIARIPAREFVRVAHVDIVDLCQSGDAGLALTLATGYIACSTR